MIQLKRPFDLKNGQFFDESLDYEDDKYAMHYALDSLLQMAIGAGFLIITILLIFGNLGVIRHMIAILLLIFFSSLHTYIIGRKALGLNLIICNLVGVMIVYLVDSFAILIYS